MTQEVACEALRLLEHRARARPRAPLRHAYKALRDAGHEPEVVKAYGSQLLPDAINRTAGRREVKRLTGRTAVPVLVTDGGEVIPETKRIVEWAKSNPATATRT